MTGMRCAVRPWEGHDALQLCAVGKISAGEEIVRERPLVKVGLGPYRYGTYPWELVHQLLATQDTRKEFYSWNLAQYDVASYLPQDEQIEKALSAHHAVSRKIVKGLYLTVVTNNMCWFSPERKIAGFGMYKQLSRANHSCVPSARMIPGEPHTSELVMVALRDIDDGEEITWSYMEEGANGAKFADADYLTRNWNLFNAYNFICSCALCAKDIPTELVGIDMRQYFMAEIAAQSRTVSSVLSGKSLLRS